jgi:DNA-binding GntR family transcriptional regulator
MENNISSIPLSVKPVERTNQYHEEIYAALKDRDVRRAQDLMLKHIQEIHDALEALSKKNFRPNISRKNKKS